MGSMRFGALAMVVVAGVAASLSSPSAALQTAADPRSPEALARLVACRSVADPAARLDCYDQATAELSSAAERGDVMVIDRDQAAVAGRQLFGFEVPSLTTLFSPRAGEAPIDAIETTLASARRADSIRWVFDLTDGSRWAQIDSAPVRFQTREGQPVRVRRAALGSYLLTVGGSRAVRVRRQ